MSAPVWRPLGRTVSTLAEVHPQDREFYVPNRNGGYSLDEKIREMADFGDAREVAFTEQLAALDRRDQADRALLRRLTISVGIRREMVKAGTKTGAVEMFSELFETDVDPEGRVVVAGENGPVDLEFAITGWLRTEIGRAYMPARPEKLRDRLQ